MKGLGHSQYGDPLDVLTLSNCSQHELKAGFLRLKVLFSPINPADVNMCEGRYLVQPELPALLGNEGLAEVIELGEGCSSFELGDRVIVPLQEKKSWLGFWQEQLIVDSTRCILVPHSISNEQAAMLTVNPLTAYLMLTQFVSLRKGDWIIQNLSNSAVGQWVIFLAKKMGLHVVSCLRNEAAIPRLQHLGSDEIVLESHRFSSLIKQKGHCRLALNGAGGQSASEIAKCLSQDGLLMTYGAMSKEHVSLPNALLIYKNITAKGFNRNYFLRSKSSEEIKIYYKELFQLIGDDFCSIPIDSVYSMTDFEAAFRRHLDPSRQGKILLAF